MSKIKYIVASTPRSATGWASRALSAMGLSCGHEQWFHYGRQQTHIAADNPNAAWGDASWLATPFISTLPKNTLILHQIRTPRESIASLVSLGHFDKWEPTANQYKAFMQQRMPGRMPDGADAIGRAAHFWAAWHRWIELQATSTPELKYFRYRVEDAPLRDIYCEITGRNPTDELLGKARAVSTKYNSGQGKKPALAKFAFPAHITSLMAHYGYTV